MVVGTVLLLVIQMFFQIFDFVQKMLPNCMFNSDEILCRKSGFDGISECMQKMLPTNVTARISEENR